MRKGAMAEEDTHIFLDESGFTGEDLLHPGQPAFCIASTNLDDDTASAYHAELLERSSAQEVKHSRLVRRTYGRAKIARFLERAKASDAFCVWVCHKRFALLTYFIDLWCEALAHRDGLDLYRDGAALAMSNMPYYCLPAHTGQDFLTSILRDFQMMMTKRDRNSYERLVSNLSIKFYSSDRDVQDILLPFVASIRELGYGLLHTMESGAIDPAVPGLVQICHMWRSRMAGPFVLHHDQSTQLSRDTQAWELVISDKMSPREFSTTEQHAVFPLNVRETRFVSSLSEKQIQLCDVVAGAIAAWCRGVIRGEASEYINRLREVDVGPLIKGGIWPQPEVDPDALGMRGASGAMLDYIVAETIRHRG
jgi:Protein of unknown function (DUF3800)